MSLPHRRVPGAELRAPFPLRIALGDLDLMDQVMMRNHLRQVASRLDLDLIPVTTGVADIRATYQGDGLRLMQAGHSVELARPLRLQPLTDALRDLAAQMALMHVPDLPPATLRDLLVPHLRVPGPLLVRGPHFGEIYIDEKYRYAFTSLEPQALHTAVAKDDHIVEIRRLAPGEFQAATARDSGRRAVQIEELCWSLDLDAVFAPFRHRWFARDEMTCHLQSWPNLSHQADYEAWLPILGRAMRAPASRAELRALAVRAGMTPERFEQGLALLILFRHAVRTNDADEPATTASPAMTFRAFETPVAPSGLLGRLRNRLRMMLPSPVALSTGTVRP